MSVGSLIVDISRNHHSDLNETVGNIRIIDDDPNHTIDIYDLVQMVRDLQSEVANLKTKLIQTEKLEELEKLKTELAAVKTEMTDVVKSKPNNELILKQTTDLVIASSKQVAKEVHTKLVHMINTEIAPRVNAALEYVSIATEDPSETVEMYQREVDYKSRPEERQRVAGLIGYDPNQVPGTTQDGTPFISPFVKFGLAPK